MTFDFDTFEKTLYRECKEVFPKIITALSHEDIYSMALYYSGEDWQYLFPTVSTKKGLSETVLKYKKSGHWRDKDTDNIDTLLEDLLKWSPCDSPHHDDYASALQDTEKMLLDADIMDNEEIDTLEDWEEWSPNDENIFIEYDSKITEICMNVLSRLDQEGVFKKLDRSSWVLNLLQGDQSEEERLSHAKALNPNDAFMQYKTDIAKQKEAYKWLY